MSDSEENKHNENHDSIMNKFLNSDLAKNTTLLSKDTLAQVCASNLTKQEFNNALKKNNDTNK